MKTNHSFSAPLNFYCKKNLIHRASCGFIGQQFGKSFPNNEDTISEFQPLNSWIKPSLKLFVTSLHLYKVFFFFLPISTSVSSVQFSSVTQSCLTLCDLMNRSTPGLPVHYQLLEFTQTNVHRAGDAIQPSHSLSSPSPPAFNLSQHQGLFQ